MISRLYLIGFLVALLATAALGADDVQIQIYAMAKCPDCASFVEFFTYVFKELQPIMKIEMDYVAQVNERTHEVTCMHGEGECEGSRYELCAQKHYSDENDWFPFVECSDNEYSSIPNNMKECASQSNLDWSVLQDCYDKEGDDLLYTSVEKSKKAGIQWAPSIIVGGKFNCTWNEPSCFSSTHSGWIKAICGLYEGTPPPACNN